MLDEQKIRSILDRLPLQSIGVVGDFFLDSGDDLVVFLRVLEKI